MDVLVVVVEDSVAATIAIASSYSALLYVNSISRLSIINVTNITTVLVCMHSSLKASET